MKKKYKGFPDKPEFEYIHFQTYCLMKINLAFDLINAGLRKQEDFESVLYPFYLKEKKKYWKHIQSLEIASRELVDKIHEDTIRKWKIIVKLASLEHKQWCHWTEYMLNNLTKKNIRRWKKQIKIPYSKLTKKEQESDIDWAMKSFNLMEKERNKPKIKESK